MNAAAADVERDEVIVSRTRDGEVTLAMSPGNALILARIIARFDVILTWSPADLRRYLFEDPTTPDAPALPGLRDYDAEVWHRVLVQLLAEAQLSHRPPVEVVDVLRVARGDEHRLVEPAPNTVPLEGATVRLKTFGMQVVGLPLREVTVVGWVQRIDGRSWTEAVDAGDEVALRYAARRQTMGLPYDESVLLTRDHEGRGQLIHVTEIDSVVAQ